ncbi:hypothetical protein DSL72_009509 [Monilinia vaccinii-corymbosi]|uniref:2EXR domain-containing protein n=1 Tax=Monilinia vaccinii-corymbosi TaxID=61207 RepID=A0A8A3PRE4_9HELO|nr:hypothetical protein DSL72_009509 [Monilinia vaccinii-corymbosi]
MTSLETFTLFADLPIELQDQIWNQTLPGPRIMGVSYNPILPNGQYASTKTPDLYSTFPRSHRRHLPVALHVNQASRNYALSKLTARFHCYWNAHIDIPYIPAKEYRKAAARYILSHLAESKLLDGFRNLALDVDILNEHAGSPDAVESIRMCPDLTNLYLVYPSVGIQGGLEDPDNSKAWSVEPQSESMMGLVSETVAMRKVPKDVLAYLRDEDRVALEDSPERTSKLNIDPIIWTSTTETRDL